MLSVSCLNSIGEEAQLWSGSVLNARDLNVVRVPLISRYSDGTLVPAVISKGCPCARGPPRQGTVATVSLLNRQADINPWKGDG
jgi:hypothetical protein